MDCNKEDTTPPDDGDDGVAEHIRSFKQQIVVQISLAKWLVSRLILSQQSQNTTPCTAEKQPQVTTPQFTSVNNLHRKQNKPGPKQPTFWTLCPFCTVKYQYYRKDLNKVLVCNGCKKPFVAYDLKMQGVPLGAASIQPTVSQRKEVSQNAPKVRPQSSARDFSSNVADQGRCDRRTAAFDLFSNKPSISKVNEGSKLTAEQNGSVTGEDSKQNGKKPMFSGRKRRRSEEECSESFDTENSNSSDEFAIMEDSEGGSPLEHNSRIPEGQDIRRSARKKRQVVYNEVSDDDTVGF